MTVRVILKLLTNCILNQAGKFTPAEVVTHPHVMARVAPLVASSTDQCSGPNPFKMLKNLIQLCIMFVKLLHDCELIFMT